MSNFLLESATPSPIIRAKVWGIDTVGANVVAKDNNFTGNGLAIDDWEGTNNNITAENNWWGNAGGPGVGGANPVGLFGVATSTTTPIDWTNPAAAAISIAVAVTNVLGQQVYDTATVTGTPAAFHAHRQCELLLVDRRWQHRQLVDTERSELLCEYVLAAGGQLRLRGQYMGDSNYRDRRCAAEPLTINQGRLQRATTIDNAATSAAIGGTGALGKSVYDTATVTGSAVHAHRHGDLRLLQHGEPGVRHDDPGSTQTVTLSGRQRAQFGGDGGLDGGELLVHRRLQRRQQLRGLHRRGRAVDDQPGLVEREHGDRRFDQRRAVTERAGRAGLRHGDGDGDAVHAHGHGDLLLLHTATRSTAPRRRQHADGDVERQRQRCPIRRSTAALTAGSYSFIGVYSGDSNYAGYTGAVEPLTINQGSSSVSTAIDDSPAAGR